MAPELFVLLNVLGTVVDALSLLNIAEKDDASAAKRSPGRAWNHDVLLMKDAPLVSPIGGWFNEWSLCDAKTDSNLDGMGPDLGVEKSIRFNKVGKGVTQDGAHIKFDLVVTADSHYYANEVTLNGVGMGGCFGIINLRSGNHVDLLFAFYEHGTNKSLALERFFFTVYDLDTNQEGEAEAITINRRADKVYYEEDHAFEVSGELKSADGLTCTATELGTGHDNPKNPVDLSPKQRSHSIMAEYTGTTMWKITFHLDGFSGGRNFAFAGKANMGPDAPEPDKVAQDKTTTTRYQNKPPGPTTTNQNKPLGPTTTTTSCVSSSCVVYADPHVVGFDNSDNQGPAYLALIDAQESGLSGEVSHSFDQRPLDVNALETGDFWLVKSKSVLVQARYRLSGEFKPDRAAVGAVAVGGPFLNGHELVVEPLDGSIRLDGVELQSLDGTYTHRGGFVIRHDPESSSVRAELPLQVNLDFKRFAKHIDVKITMPPLQGGVDGECGNYDGIAENDEENDIAGRMGSLIVTDSERMFATKFDDIQVGTEGEAEVAMKDDDEVVTEVDEDDVRASSKLRGLKNRLAQAVKSFMF